MENNGIDREKNLNLGMKELRIHDSRFPYSKSIKKEILNPRWKRSEYIENIWIGMKELRFHNFLAPNP